MKKVLLLLDCDLCRNVYEYTRFASEDTTAWDVHGSAISRMAFRDGWARTCDDNSHYCPSWIEQLDEQFQLELLFD